MVVVIVLEPVLVERVAIVDPFSEIVAELIVAPPFGLNIETSAPFDPVVIKLLTGAKDVIVGGTAAEPETVLIQTS